MFKEGQLVKGGGRLMVVSSGREKGKKGEICCEWVDNEPDPETEEVSGNIMYAYYLPSDLQPALLIL